MDAKRATEVAIDYFKALGGSIGPIGFAVKSVEQANGDWVVTCSMWDFIGARERSEYEVIVTGATETVQKVRKIGP